MKFTKKGGLIGDLVSGVGGLVLSIIVIFVVIAAITGANLLTANSAAKNSTDNLVANLSSGVDKVSTQIPTIMNIAAIVLLLGVIVFLVAKARAANLGGGGSL
ncbi:MAG: hypothetical protein WCK29_04575 [archaeon]